MKYPGITKPKRVKHFDRKISKRRIASENKVPFINLSKLDADELLKESLISGESEEIIREEENIYPDSAYDFF